MNRIIILLSFFCFSFSSCALIFNGVKQDVTVRSMTDNAKIYINGELKGKTALIERLRRNRDYVITIKKQDCETQTKLIHHDMQLIWFLFGAFLNWPGLLVDFASGAIFVLEPDIIVIELDCVTTDSN